MTKSFLLLLLSASLLGPALARPLSGTIPALLPTLADTTTPNNTLRQILDSLRRRPTLKGLKIKLQDINFETNSFVLTPGSAVYLDTIASVLNKIPAVILEIGGHTDNVGPPRNNQTLSENRAQAVRNRLVGAGHVTAKRVTFRGYGETKPVAANTSEGGRLLNRRVEMQFVGLDTDQTTKIHLRSGQVIQAAFVYYNSQNRAVLYKMGENTPLVEVPCAAVQKLVYADNREQLVDCPPPPTAVREEPRATLVAKVKTASSLYLQLNAGAGYMLGENPAWTSKTVGYAHVVGFGAGVLVGYRLSNVFRVGLQTGYWRWSTQVDYKEGTGGPVLRQYLSDATQIPLTLALSVNVTRSIYLMPEGGVNLLKMNAGFSTNRDTFSGLQTTYGGTLGYTTNRNKRVWADLGVFYRVHQKGTWDKQYGLPAMNYAGLKLGVGFGL